MILYNPCGSRDLTVDSKPLKPKFGWHGFSGLCVESPTMTEMQNFYRVGHNEPTDLSRFWVKGHAK